MRRKLLYMLLFGSLLGIPACEDNDGPLEEAGEAADDAVDEVKEAGEEVKDAVDRD